MWCYDDPDQFATMHLKHGTTSILPTFHYNMPHKEIIEGLGRVLEVMRRGHTPIVGIHMEGPYINPKYGAITSPIRCVEPQEYREMLSLAGHEIKIWTLAPELAGQTEFMEAGLRHRIVFSVGHSEASPEVIFAGYRLGLRLGCHLTNASGVTPSQTRYEGTREVGVHEAILAHDDMYAEMIPDKEGIHVRPLMQKLIVKTKGVERVIVITDAIERAGLATDRDVNMIRRNEYSPGQGDEILSGSLLTMDRAAHNIRTHTGVGIVDVCKMAALNPARLLEMDRDLGSIEKGKKANLLAVTETMNVQMVMLEGECCTPHTSY